jgi:hypothetical protein
VGDSIHFLFDFQFSKNTAMGFGRLGGMSVSTDTRFAAQTRRLVFHKFGLYVCDGAHSVFVMKNNGVD